MAMLSELLVNGVPIECINSAAVQYHVPATIIVTVLEIEGGKVGMASKNTNGTFDFGPMQINSIWLNKLRAYGFTQDDLQYNPCINVWVGTWILSQRIANSPEFWRGVASYHSYSLPENTAYKSKVLGAYQTLTTYLSGKS